LLAAGKRLFSKVGVDGATIQQITDEAGVGFGSFYNHFESKQAMVDALVEAYLHENAGLRKAPEIGDLEIAEQISAWLRFVLERAIADRDWGMFFCRTSVSMIAGRTGYISALASDIRQGMKRGRFSVDDFDVTLFAIVGANLTCLQASIEGEIKREQSARVATFTLTALGIPADEAREIARRPLPAPMRRVLAATR
jgi:AcrR family transcriptional regulator